MAAEKEFENQIKKWMHSVGIYPAGCVRSKMKVPQRGWYTKIWGGGFQKSGIPDLLICVDGWFIGCEIKAQTGQPTALQILNLRQIHESLGFAVLLYPTHDILFKNFIMCILEHDYENMEFNYELLSEKWKHFEHTLL